MKKTQVKDFLKKAISQETAKLIHALEGINLICNCETELVANNLIRFPEVSKLKDIKNYNAHAFIICPKCRRRWYAWQLISKKPSKKA